MGFLSRKPKISVEDFCQQFYDSEVFHATIAGTDAWSSFLEIAFKSVSEADQSFAVIDKTVFQREMTGIRLELFGLAWGHKLKKEKFTIPQSLFTKRYLEENEGLQIWDIMGEYNKAIAESSIEIASGERSRRGWITFMNVMRSEIFKKWAKANVANINAMTQAEKDQLTCVARAINRLGTEVAWEKGITTQYLTARLADRLGCNENLNSEALFRLAALIHGLYEGAMEAIKESF